MRRVIFCRVLTDSRHSTSSSLNVAYADELAECIMYDKTVSCGTGDQICVFVADIIVLQWTRLSWSCCYYRPDHRLFVLLLLETISCHSQQHFL